MIQWKLDCWSRKHKRKNQQIIESSILIGLFFRFYFSLQQTSFH